MKELYLSVFLREDNSFKVYRQLLEPVRANCSVLKVDYNFTPWPRVNGNLLWP